MNGFGKICFDLYKYLATMGNVLLHYLQRNKAKKKTESLFDAGLYWSFRLPKILSSNECHILPSPVQKTVSTTETMNKPYARRWIMFGQIVMNEADYKEMIYTS